MKHFEIEDASRQNKLSKELKVPLICKKVFSFSNDLLLSPLCLPRDILEEIVSEVQNKITDKPTVYNMAFFEGLKDLKSHKTNQEKYPTKLYWEGLREGKKHLEYLDRIRGTDIKKILGKNKKVLEWWTSI